MSYSLIYVIFPRVFIYFGVISKDGSRVKIYISPTPRISFAIMDGPGRGIGIDATHKIKFGQMSVTVLRMMKEQTCNFKLYFSEAR